MVGGGQEATPPVLSRQDASWRVALLTGSGALSLACWGPGAGSPQSLGPAHSLLCLVKRGCWPPPTGAQIFGPGICLGIQPGRSPSPSPLLLTPTLHLPGLVLPPQPWPALPEAHFCSKCRLRGTNQREMRPCSRLPRAEPPALLWVPVLSAPRMAPGVLSHMCCSLSISTAQRTRPSLPAPGCPCAASARVWDTGKCSAATWAPLRTGPSPPTAGAVRSSGPHFPGVRASPPDEASGAGALHNSANTR